MYATFRRTILAALVVAAFTIAVSSAGATATTCTATGFVRDGMDLTAAVIDPATTVTGTIDATGCNIGVYYSPGHTGSVSGATVENANYYGVVNNGSSVTVSNSTINHIGETPLNGTQHGVGIYFAFEGNSTGTIKNNTVTNYQKGGITVNGPGSSATISGNTVTGQGPVNYIAQNGIQIGFGATGEVTKNTVTGNEYTGANLASSAGILVVGGPFFSSAFSSGISIVKNTVTNNDVGVWLSNAEGDGSAPLTPTNNSVVNNTIAKTDGITNVTGFSATCGYQAGIADEGNGDNINNNKISGNGYTPDRNCDTGTYVRAIDPLGPVHVKHNK